MLIASFLECLSSDARLADAFLASVPYAAAASPEDVAGEAEEGAAAGEADAMAIGVAA